MLEGTADAKRVEIAFRLILRDPNVKAILVNIFGGIVRCDRVAQGIVDAYNNMGDISVPIIVRLQGTNAEIAKEIIDNCDFKVYSATEFQEAADKIQEVLDLIVKMSSIFLVFIDKMSCICKWHLF